jgi:hypothetical protein
MRQSPPLFASPVYHTLQLLTNGNSCATMKKQSKGRWRMPAEM